MTTITINIESSEKTNRAVIFDIHQELAGLLIKYQDEGLIKGMTLLDNGHRGTPSNEIKPSTNL